MSEHPLDKMTKKLLLILLLLLSPFAALVVFAFYKKYEQTANSVIVGIAIIVAISFIIYYTYFKPQKQQARVEYLNRILGRYGRRSPAPPVPHIILDEDFLAITAKMEQLIVTSAAGWVLSKYIDVVARKRKQTIYRDDYGREIRGAWDRELDYFITTVFLPELAKELTSVEIEVQATASLLEDSEESIRFWTTFIDTEITENSKLQGEIEFDEFMSGHEYEHFVAGLIKQHGWDARVTSGSGDHGADIIVEKKDLRLAVQCKLYSSPVGNKSVQEAFSAQSFYDCGLSCVVTNSSFTPAAKKAASKLNVSLLHHEDLGKFLTGLA